MSIENPVHCGLTVWNGTPVFVLPQIGTEAKRIFGATLLKRDDVWLFPAYYPYVEDVLHDFEIVVPGLVFSDNAQKHLDRLQVPAVPLPDTAFITQPFDHQREGTEYVLQRLRCALFFDCGLGKTKTVIDALRVLKEKTLVLSPVVGLPIWCYEVGLHSEGELTAMALSGESPRAREARLAAEREKRKLKKALKTDSGNTEIQMRLVELKEKSSQKAAKRIDIEEAADHADILVVSYDTAKLYQEEIFSQFPYKIIVADESHFLRGHTSHRTRAAQALASKAYRRVLLSGTPTLGNPLHLFSQLAFLAPYIPAPNFFIFRKHFVIRGNKKHNRKMVFGYKNLDALNEKVQRIALRKTKDACLDLPPQTIIDINFEISTEQKKAYNELVKYSCIDLGDGKLYEADHAAAVLQKLLQVLSGFIIVPPEQICDGCEHVQHCVDDNIKPYTEKCKVQQKAPPKQIKRMKKNGKLDAFSELMDSLLASENNKVIVWAYFREELNILEEYLNDQKIGYVRVDGSNSRHVQKYAEQFNTNPQTRVYLAQVGTGVAITLNAAAYTIYYGITYRLDEYLQSLDRNYRIGQKSPVFAYRLIAKGSVLEFVTKALEMKEDLAETLTTRIDCVLCANSAQCVARGIVPFGDGCIHKSKMKRVITQPGILE